MKTASILAQVQEYMDKGDFSTLENLVRQLENKIKIEQFRKEGGNVAANRLKAVNKALKVNASDHAPEQLSKVYNDIISGEEMQVCLTRYFLIALKSKYAVPVDACATATNDDKKPNFAKLMPSLQCNYKEVNVDISEVKAELVRWKARQRVKAKKEREKCCIVNIGDFADVGFNAEYLALLHDVLKHPAGVKFFQNQNAYRFSYFESPVGVCVICPCKTKNNKK